MIKDIAKVAIGPDNGDAARIEVLDEGKSAYEWASPDGVTTDIRTLGIGEKWLSADGQMSVENTKDGYKFALIDNRDAGTAGNASMYSIDVNQKDAFTGNLFDIVKAGANRDGGRIEWAGKTTPHGEFTVSDDGTWSFVPNQERLASMAKDSVEYENLDYKYVDGEGHELAGK